MRALRMFGVVVLVAAAGVLASAANAGEPASFTERVQRSQVHVSSDRQPGSATRAAAGNVEESQGEPTSFIARVEQSQGIVQSNPGIGGTGTAESFAPTEPGEPRSFIERVEQSQRVGPSQLHQTTAKR